MLDRDLARLYGVSTKVFNQAIGRNRDRFPPDFMFGLMKNEFENFGLQFVTSSQRAGRRYFPYAFTEQRVVMLSSALKSKRAIYASIEIMRAFVRFRRILASNEELSYRLGALEKKSMPNSGLYLMLSDSSWSHRRENGGLSGPC